MGELRIHVKVLKNSPLLFTWLNKYDDVVEGCLVTCPCQNLGLIENSKSGKKSATLDQNLLGKALKKATILSTPGECDTGSVFLPTKKRTDAVLCCHKTEKLRSDQSCSKENDKIKFTTHVKVNESNHQTKTLTIRLDDNIIGTASDDSCHHSDCENSLKEDMNDVCMLLENKEKNELGATKSGVNSKDSLKSGVILPSAETPSFGQRTESCSTGTKDDFVNEVGSESRVKEHRSDDSDRSNLKGGARYQSNCEGDETIGQIENGSSLSNPHYVRKDGQIEGHSMSEIERTQVDTTKSKMDPISITDHIQQSSDMNTRRDLPIHAPTGLDKDSTTVTLEPKVDSRSKQNMSIAMLKYKQYEKEKFLEKLHKFGGKKNKYVVICEVCGALLSNKTLKNHMEVIHSTKERERNFECDICNKKFLKEINLVRHKISHTDYMSKCRFCEKKFKYDYYRKAHEKFHTENPPPVPVRKPRKLEKKLQENRTVDESHKPPRIFICNVCGKAVRMAGKYQHLQIHKEKKYPCSSCGFKLTTAAALKMHMKKHTQECNIPCRHCGKLFKRYQERLNHERIHTNEKPFICETCDKCWRDRGTYLCHMKKHHPGMPLMYLRPPVRVPPEVATSTRNVQGSEEKTEMTKAT